MNKIKFKYKIITAILFISILSSCLRETALPIESIFSIEVGEDKTSPLSVIVNNKSYGADSYEWEFEGGIPSESKEKNPGEIIFTQAGEHKIRLKVWNVIEERISEQTIVVDSAMIVDFDFSIAINNIAPGLVSINNKSKGGYTYEWIFDGGTPSSSNEVHPAPITFSNEGEHKIHLKVFNGSKYEEKIKSFTLLAPMKADFSYEPLPIDSDWEAPLTLTTTNTTTGATTYKWSCNGGTIISPTDKTTNVYFEKPGTYKLKLIASNGKESKTIEKTITIKENSGILKHNNLKFGINQAQNSIGCFYSSNYGGVFTSAAVKEREIGEKVDLGFFAINSTFNYCYFFSPDKASKHAFPSIESANSTVFINNPNAFGIKISNLDFENISKPSDFNKYTKWEETNLTTFTMQNKPNFVLFKTNYGQRGIIQIIDYIKNGKDSYILANIKIEKRKNE